ncbi:MAG: efflux RND transporter periplasmic adaptor subunit [Balneolales bacterium]
MNWKKTLLFCLIILLAGAAATVLIFSTEPTASRSGATRDTAMLVDVTQARRGSFHPMVEAVGTVQPSQDINLSPRVGGEIQQLSPDFTPGGYVQQGEMLLQIDPADYRNLLQQRRSELRQAESDLTIEMGRQNVARQDYELLDDSLMNENRSLVLREPQLNAARAIVESAEAAAQQAELDLDRTTIRAPFNAYIISRNANVGSQVAAGDDLGRLVGLENYWVVATVSQSNLRWITIPSGNEGNGSDVRIRNRTAWGEDEYRQGYVYKLVGALEDQTRMARILVNVPDPHGYQTGNTELPPLMIGSFVETIIQGEELTDVVRLNRDYIRQNDKVWVMEDDVLRIRDANIIFQDAQYAYITNGLNDGDQVVTSNLTTVVDGSPLRLSDSDNTAIEETTFHE